MAKDASGDSCTVNLIAEVGAECAFQARVIKDSGSQEVLQHRLRANQFMHLGTNRGPKRIVCVLGVCGRKCVHLRNALIIVTAHISAET